ncbi:hypothetical protein D3C77_600030 [compost metagenome]
MSRAPASTIHAARAKVVSTSQSKSSTSKPPTGASTALAINTGVSMLTSHWVGVSFQRTITPMAMTTISKAINGRNSASKYGGPTDSLAPVSASRNSG